MGEYKLEILYRCEMLYLDVQVNACDELEDLNKNLEDRMFRESWVCKFYHL